MDRPKGWRDIMGREWEIGRNVRTKETERSWDFQEHLILVLTVRKEVNGGKEGDVVEKKAPILFAEASICSSPSSYPPLFLPLTMGGDREKGEWEWKCLGASSCSFPFPPPFIHCHLSQMGVTMGGEVERGRRRMGAAWEPLLTLDSTPRAVAGKDSVCVGTKQPAGITALQSLNLNFIHWRWEVPPPASSFSYLFLSWEGTRIWHRFIVIRIFNIFLVV